MLNPMLPHIERVIDWTIPLYGNKRLFPYGTLKISDGKTKKVVKTKEEGGKTFFTFQRKRYLIKNIGSLYSPNLQVCEWR